MSTDLSKPWPSCRGCPPSESRERRSRTGGRHSLGPMWAKLTQGSYEIAQVPKRRESRRSSPSFCGNGLSPHVQCVPMKHLVRKATKRRCLNQPKRTYTVRNPCRLARNAFGAIWRRKHWHLETLEAQRPAVELTSLEGAIPAVELHHPMPGGAPLVRAQNPCWGAGLFLCKLDLRRCSHDRAKGF